jgi:hypothetical protein
MNSGPWNDMGVVTFTFLPLYFHFEGESPFYLSHSRLGWTQGPSDHIGREKTVSLQSIEPCLHLRLIQEQKGEFRKARVNRHEFEQKSVICPH